MCETCVCARANILISLCDDPSRIQTAGTKLMSNQNPLAGFRGPHISPLLRLNNEEFRRLSSPKVQLRGPSEIRFDSAAPLLHAGKMIRINHGKVRSLSRSAGKVICCWRFPL